MSPDLRSVVPAEPSATATPTTATPASPGDRSTRTGAGVALQATWLAVIAYNAWGSVALPPHPEPSPAVSLLLTVCGFAILAAAGGLLLRRRWALWTSTALVLPMVTLAVLCVLADAGSHWIAEAGLAVAVLVFTLHPGSWRMHTR